MGEAERAWNLWARRCVLEVTDTCAATVLVSSVLYSDQEGLV